MNSTPSLTRARESFARALMTSECDFGVSLVFPMIKRRVGLVISPR